MLSWPLKPNTSAFKTQNWNTYCGGAHILAALRAMWILSPHTHTHTKAKSQTRMEQWKPPLHNLSSWKDSRVLGNREPGRQWKMSEGNPAGSTVGWQRAKIVCVCVWKRDVYIFQYGKSLTSLSFSLCLTHCFFTDERMVWVDEEAYCCS